MNRVTKRTIKNLSNVVLSEESFGYDAAGNITSAPTGSFAYDTDNRLTAFNGNTVSYDMDGNLLSNGAMTCTYDSANRLLTSGGHTYTYNAEGVRIRNLCAGEDAAYTYNTNSKLSQLLMKTVGTAVTKYVYGLGLIGEETDGDFKTYHFDSRGSTIAITDEDGNITDTFAYDTYGKMTSRTGTTPVIFGYNGRYGVVTDANGLLYMRARYYSPVMRRFVNADVIPGNISKAVTLNRYAFADANPVLKVDPLGLSSEYSKEDVQKDLNLVNADLMSDQEFYDKYGYYPDDAIHIIATKTSDHTMDNDAEPDYVDENVYKGLDRASDTNTDRKNPYSDILGSLEEQLERAILAHDINGNVETAKTVSSGIKQIQDGIKLVKRGDYLITYGKTAAIYSLKIRQRRIRYDNVWKYPNISKYVNPGDAFKNSLKNTFDVPGVALDIVGIGLETAYNVSQYESAEDQWIIGAYTIGTGAISAVGSAVASAGAVAVYTKFAMAIGTAVSPGLGTIIGAGVGFLAGITIDWIFDPVDRAVENYLANN